MSQRTRGRSRRPRRRTLVRRRELCCAIAAVLATAAAGETAWAREVPFAEPPAISSSVDTPFSVVAADIDGDGDLDAVAPAFLGDAIYWLENTAGDGSAWTLHTISTLLSATNGAYAVSAADLDGDGDLDVVSSAAQFTADSVFWHENLNGDGSAWSAHTIATLVDGARAAVAADLDGDGDLDVVSVEFDDDEVIWFENDGSAGTWTAHLVFTMADGVNSAFAADLDGDGDMDLMSTARDGDSVYWHENTAGDGSAWSTQTISAAADSARSVVAADVDGDGHLDVVSGSGYDAKVAWYRNVNGDGSTWSLHTVTTAGGRVQSVFAADADADGDVDLFSAGWISDNVTWYENTSGDGTGWVKRTITTNVDYGYAVFAADVDGDGDLDTLSASGRDDKIAWYRNDSIHRSARFPKQIVISNTVIGARTVFAGDINGDGNTDALSASFNTDRIAWHENDGSGTTWTLHTVSTAVDGAQGLFAADIDGDGDLDVASTAYLTPDAILWHENDGTGGGWTLHTIRTSGLSNPAFVTAADLDGDGDTDIVSGYDARFAWFENDGAGASWTTHTISLWNGGSRSAFPADIDRDGDLDLLVATGGSLVAWLENDGAGGFVALNTVSTSVMTALSVFAADVDGDGDPDAISASSNDDKVAWYENDGAGGGWTLHTITTSADGANNVHAADLDGDGDIDVASTSGLDDKVAWYENTAGDGTAWAMQTVTLLADGARSVVVADLDGDADPDLLSGSFIDDTVAWHENRGGQFALPTLDIAQKVVGNSETHDLLDIQAVHRGRMGDSDAELVTLELKFNDDAGVDLTSAEADNLIEELRIHLDDGSGEFEAGSDATVHTIGAFSLTAGVETISFTDGNPNAQLPFGAPKLYFVVADITANADVQVPSAFQAGHVTESSSTGEDAAADIPLSLEFWPNTGTGVVDTAFSTESCQAPFDLQLSNRTVNTTVVCQAGTEIRAGTAFTVDAPGDLTFRAGEAVRLNAGFKVDDGTFTVEIDPALKP